MADPKPVDPAPKETPAPALAPVLTARRVPPLYQRYSDTGVPRENRAGVEAVLKSGEAGDGARATWLVDAASLMGLVPQPGDYLRDVRGVWWVCVEVQPPAGGAYPLACERWKDGGE